MAKSESVKHLLGRGTLAIWHSRSGTGLVPAFEADTAEDAPQGRTTNLGIGAERFVSGERQISESAVYVRVEVPQS